MYLLPALLCQLLPSTIYPSLHQLIEEVSRTLGRGRWCASLPSIDSDSVGRAPPSLSPWPSRSLRPDSLRYNTIMCVGAGTSLLPSCLVVQSYVSFTLFSVVIILFYSIQYYSECSPILSIPFLLHDNPS